MLGCSVHTLPFFAPCDAMLTILVYAAHWLSMHLYMLAYMFMHESCLLVCRPYFYTMKSWTSYPNLHLSLTDTTFCLLSCLSDFLLVCLLPCSFAYHVYHAYLFYASFICSMYLFLSIACLLVSCLCLCMYTHEGRTHGARAQSPRRKQKGRGCEHVNISQVAVFSRFRGLTSPIWSCTLLNPFPSSLRSLLDGLH